MEKVQSSNTLEAGILEAGEMLRAGFTVVVLDPETLERKTEALSGGALERISADPAHAGDLWGVRVTSGPRKGEYLPLDRIRLKRVRSGAEPLALADDDPTIPPDKRAKVVPLAPAKKEAKTMRAETAPQKIGEGAPPPQSARSEEKARLEAHVAAKLEDALAVAGNGRPVVPFNPILREPWRPFTWEDSSIVPSTIRDMFSRVSNGLPEVGVANVQRTGGVMLTRHNREELLHPKRSEEDERKEEFERALSEGTRTLGAILADDAPPPPSILGNGLLRAGLVGQVHGPDGSGKTWALLALAVSAAAGRPWFGVLTREEGLRVGLLSLEDPRWILRDRLQAILQAEEIDPEEIGDRVVLYDPDSVPTIDGALDLTNETELGSIIEWTKRHTLDLLLVDHLSCAHELGDERDLRPVAKALKTIALQCGAGVLFAHHDRKSAPGARRTDTFASRGDSRLSAMTRLKIAMVENGGRIRLTFEKTTGGAKPGVIWLEHAEGGALTVTAAPKKAAEKAAENLERMTLMIRDAGPKGVTPGEIAAALQVSERTVQTYGKRLEGVERVGKTSSVRYIGTDSLFGK